MTGHHWERPLRTSGQPCLGLRLSCVSERYYERCSCPDENNCGIRSVMKEVREAIVKILESVTLAQLCDRVRKLQGQHASPLDYVI